ncbi:RPM1-interacting protein 4-like isoform X1 [Curcuma longa]|uniref:RPM1-interacting protein 4-like isoform X1 n=1 Tax=Curcuma longa TaxID=136217 RepID=UPI003D9E7FD7
MQWLDQTLVWSLVIEQRGGHVPRFGDWNQNAAYTTYFDTARKGKTPGANILNPNDPEQMAELHRAGGQPVEPQYPNQGHRDKPTEYDGANHHPRANYGREEREWEDIAQAPPQSRNSSQRSNVDQQGRNHGTRRSMGEAGQFPSRSPVTQGRASNALQGTTGRQRATAIPKFGDWDAPDPQPNGYTVIFNQVKEDRKAAAATHIPPIPPQPVRPPTDNKSYRQKESFWSWLCPCLRPSAS